MLLPLFIWQDKVLKRIRPEDIVVITSEKNYIKIYVVQGKYYLVRSSLAAALEKLPPELFKRIHKWLVVSLNFIDDIARDHLIIDGDREAAPISRQHYHAFINSLNIIGGDESAKKKEVKNRGK